MMSKLRTYNLRIDQPSFETVEKFSNFISFECSIDAVQNVPVRVKIPKNFALKFMHNTFYKKILKARQFLIEKFGNSVFSYVATKSTIRELKSVNYGFRMIMQSRLKIVRRKFEDAMEIEDCS